jgi:hypothetical protein
MRGLLHAVRTIDNATTILVSHRDLGRIERYEGRGHALGAGRAPHEEGTLFVRK